MQRDGVDQVTDSVLAESSPARRRGVYFGWRVVVALFLCTSALFGVAMYGFIMLNQPLAAQFGWSAAQTGSLTSAMWLAGPVALVAGPFVERFGAWRFVVVGMLVQAVVLAVMIFVSEFWQLYVLRITMGVGKIMVLTAAPVIVSRWFRRRFATAMAIAWSGGAAGGIVMAPLTEALASALGWRATALILAGGLLAVVALAGLLARGAIYPAQLGLRCDGDVDPRGVRGDAAAAVDDEPKLHWRDALQSLDWLKLSAMALATIGAGMGAIGIQSQQPALFEAAGLSHATAAALLGLTAAACLAGALIAGWLLDRVHSAWTSVSLTISLLGGLLAMAAVIHAPSLAMGVIAACSLGYAIGGAEILWITLFKREFGAAAFATTYGIFYFCLQVGYATGGLIGGWSFEHLLPLGFLVVAALWYLPSAGFSLWRPGATARR